MEDRSFYRTDALLDASQICAHGLRSVEKKRKLHTAISFILLVTGLLLITAIISDVSAGTRLFLTCLLVFTLMSMFYDVTVLTVTCSHESRCLLGIKQALEVLLDEVRMKNAKLFHNKR